MVPIIFLPSMFIKSDTPGLGFPDLSWFDLVLIGGCLLSSAVIMLLAVLKVIGWQVTMISFGCVLGTLLLYMFYLLVRLIWPN